MRWLALAGIGCSTPYSEMLVYEWQGDGAHELQAVPLGAVEDAVRMRTSLGDARRGGHISVGLTSLEAEVRVGEPVHLRHHVTDGVFVPQDEQGLLLASFFHHLGDVRTEFEALGYRDATTSLFPVDAVAYNLRQLSDLLSFENAGYAALPDFQGFVLFPDANRRVPLGAHIAVVRHEFGHGFVANHIPLFHPDNVDAADDIIGTTPLRAVNEGVADLVAVLTLDDPTSLPVEGREASEFRDIFEVDVDDPYSTGVVIASFGWFLRTQIGDAPQTLQLMIEALERWDAEAWEIGATTPTRYAAWMAQVVIEDRPDLAKPVCDAFVERFGNGGPPCS